MGSVKWRLTGWRYFGTRCSTYSIIKDTTVIVAAVPLSAPTNRIKSVLGFELPISRMFIGFALAAMYYLWSMVYRLNWMPEFSSRTLLVTPTPPPLQRQLRSQSLIAADPVLPMMMMMRDVLDDSPCDMTSTRHSLDDTYILKSILDCYVVYLWGFMDDCSVLFGSCEGVKCRRGLSSNICEGGE